MKKHVPFILGAIACLGITGSILAAQFYSSEQPLTGRPVNVIPLENGAALVTDKMSDADLDALVDEITDSEGNLLEDSDERRQDFMDDFENFRVVTADGSTYSVDSTPFTVSLESASEDFDYTFYQVETSDGNLIIPQEWDVMGFIFLNSEDNSGFYACTDIGIWKLDPDNRTATKISSDSYNGQARESILSSMTSENSLFWIDNPIVSPDGKYVVYRSNRTAPDASGDCVWVLNGDTGVETQLTQNTGTYRAIQGFISNTEILVENYAGDTTSYSVLNIETGAESPVAMPQLDNLMVFAVSANGYVALSSYDDTSEDTTIVKVTSNGVSVVSELENCYGKVEFSPSGNKVGIAFNEDNSMPDNNIVIVDLVLGTTQELSSAASAQTRSIGGNIDISDFAWVNDDAILVTQEENSVANSIAGIFNSSSETTWFYHLEGGDIE